MRIIDEDHLLIDIIDRGVDHIQTDDYAEICQIIAEQPTVKAVQIEVLQEIRQEIEIQRKGFPPSADYYKAINRTLDIIDKHIKEYTV